MKKIISLVLALIMVVGILPVSAAAAEDSQSRSIQNATNIALGAKYTASWYDDTDDLSHYARFMLSQQGVVTVTATKPTDSDGRVCSFVFFIYDEDGNTVLEYDSNEAKNGLKKYYTFSCGLETGTYYLEIKPSFYVTEGLISTEYSVAFEAESYCEIEPNNSKVEATSLTLEKEYRGFAGCRDSSGFDDDYYVFSAGQSPTYSATYRISIANYAAIAGADLLIVKIQGKNTLEYIEDELEFNIEPDGSAYYDFVPEEKGIAKYYLSIVSSCKSCEYGIKISNSDSEADLETTQPTEPEAPTTPHVHNFSAWSTIVKATCERAGTKQRDCSCGEIQETSIPALDHDYQDGRCTMCKAKDPDYTPPTQPTEPSEPETPVDGSVTRLSGASRYETSFAIANEMKKVLGINKFDTIILASSDNFADALAGSYLAAQKQAPILIGKLKYTSMVCAYVNNNLATDGTVYVLGGEGAVPKAMLDGIAVTDNIVRLAGAERYDTNLAILKEAGIGSNDLLVATGRDFADSLSASATGLPILLVNGKAGKSLSADQKAFLRTVKGKIYIIGGDSAVPAALKTEIENASGKIATRIAGGSRYETSVKIAQQFFSSAGTAVVAYASTFPDGLCGGPLAYVLDAPLLLTKNGKTEAPGYTAKNSIVSGYVLGGTGLISDAFAAEIFAY